MIGSVDNLECVSYLVDRLGLAVSFCVPLLFQKGLSSSGCGRASGVLVCASNLSESYVFWAEGRAGDVLACISNLFKRFILFRLQLRRKIPYPVVHLRYVNKIHHLLSAGMILCVELSRVFQ